MVMVLTPRSIIPPAANTPKLPPPGAPAPASMTLSRTVRNASPASRRTPYVLARAPAPAVRPRLADTYAHLSTRPSEPSQFVSSKPGSMASDRELLVHAYSQPQTPVEGLLSRS